MQRKTDASAEFYFLQWCEPQLTAAMFFLSAGWCVAQTALFCIVTVTLEDDTTDTTGQLALGILWAVVGLYFWSATGDFASRARRRWRCNTCTETVSVVICALMCCITPQLSLIPRGNSLLELLEAYGHDPASAAIHQIAVEDVFSNSFWPACLLLSTSVLPMRFSRFILVPFGAVTPFFIRAACFRRLSDVMNGGVLFFISAIAIFSVHQREQLLRRCHDLDRREEDEQILVQLEQRASKNDARVRALEALTRSSCDMLLELSESLTICDSSPLLSVFFCQDVQGVPFILTVPELEQRRLSDFLLQASRKAADVMSACFTLPRGSAKLSVEYVSNSAAPHFLVAIHLQDPLEKARFAKDMALCFGDEDSRISRRTQEVCSPTSSKTTTTQNVDFPIPEERCVGSDLVDMTREEGSMGHSHTFSALARGPSSSFISASPRTSLASSHQDNEKRRGWLRSKLKKNSPMNAFLQGDDLTFLAGTALEEPQKSGTASSSLQFSHSVMSMRLDLDDSVPDMPSPMVRTAEKEIQADSSCSVSQTVQTQFTWDSEDFVCYNCLFSRPPRAPTSPSRRESGGSSPADSDSTASESSRPGSEKRLRKKKKIHLRRMNEQSLSKVWSGQLPNYDLMVPHFQQTGPKTIVRSLASLLKQWNLEYPSNVCCRYHAVTSLVVYLLTCELRCKCQAYWRPKDDWQCSHCKMLLSKEDQECSFCAFNESEEEEGLEDHQGWPLSL